MNCKKLQRTEIKKRGEVERFRSSALWQRKRKKILDRDKHLCRVCLDGKYVPKAITNQRLEVHHIVPIVENTRDRKSTRLNSSHRSISRMPSSA